MSRGRPRADLENFQSNLHTSLYALREAESRWNEVQRGAIVQDRQVASAEVDRSAASLRASQAQQLQAEVAAASAAEAEERTGGGARPGSSGPGSTE